MVIKAFDKQTEEGNHLIPADPFVAVCNGVIASGKSTVCLDLILNKFRHRYNRVVVISPTIDLDEKMKAIVSCPDLCVSNQALHDVIYNELSILDEYEEPEKLPKYIGVSEDDCHTSYNPQILQDIIDSQNYIIKHYGKKLADKILIFIDDAPALGIFRASHQDIFAKFCNTIRHYKTSTLFCSQMFKCCAKVIRHQISCGIFFASNEVEMREIWESMSCNMPFHVWSEYFRILTSKPYSHVTINLKNQKGFQMIRGFENFIA